MSAVTYGAMLAAIWVLLWGDASASNILSGIAVAVALIVFVPGAWRRSRLPVIRPLAIARLAVYLLRQLAVSNFVLAREVLARRSRIHTGVVDVPLTGCSDELLTVLANLTAMTPGTMPVDVRRDPAVMSIHVLHLGDVEEVRRELWRLRDLTVRAFGTAEAVSCLGDGP